MTAAGRATPWSASAPPVAVALDAPDAGTAVRWADAVAPSVAVLKVGLELFCREGPAVVERLRERAPVFLDLKLHDIPATVAGATRSVARLRPALLTVHAAGGAAMVRAAVDALAEDAPDALVAAVTVLTSLDGAALDAVGLGGPPREAVLRLAALAVDAGAGALVCSPQEVGAVRAEVGPDVVLVTPGVRPSGSGADDQARTAAPQAALRDGADLLVVGRPVTASADPAAAARDLAGLLRS